MLKCNLNSTLLALASLSATSLSATSLFTFLFLHRSVGYAFGILVALLVVVFFGNCSVGTFEWNYFVLDVIFGSIMAYSIGLLIEGLVVTQYLKTLRKASAKSKSNK